LPLCYLRKNVFMESWIKRLKFYGIGFGLGLIFVAFFFQNRGCSWTPSNRVKNAVLDRLIVVSDETAAVMKQKGLNNEDVVQVLNDGDVDFGKSQKEGESKIYIMQKDGIHYAFTLPYESFVSEVFVTSDFNKAENSTTGFGDIIHFPNDDNLVYPDSSKVVGCQQEVLGLINPKDIFSLIKSSGKIDFSKTDFKQRPKAEHYLVFKQEDDIIGCKVIWYKNKLNITAFESEKTAGCN
jgi:hypothetical protein